jgi:hypothetical protein
MAVEHHVLAVLPKPAPDERVIRSLEHMLDKARSGELRAFVAAAIVDDFDGSGPATTGWRAGRAPIAPFVLALERCKLRLIGFVEDIDLDLELGGM